MAARRVRRKVGCDFWGEARLGENTLVLLRPDGAFQLTGVSGGA
jgi:hypothetical protein